VNVSPAFSSSKYLPAIVVLVGADDRL
jgi:hypothetical protein